MEDSGQADLQVLAGGKVLIHTGFTEMGQGLFTVLIQTASQETGPSPPAQISSLDPYAESKAPPDQETPNEVDNLIKVLRSKSGSEIERIQPPPVVQSRFEVKVCPGHVPGLIAWTDGLTETSEGGRPEGQEVPVRLRGLPDDLPDESSPRYP